jgi:cytochrome P450
LADVDTLIADDVASIPLDTTVDLELAMGCIALRLAAWVLLGEILDRARAEDLARHQRAVVQWVGNRLGRLSAVVPLARGRAGRAMKAHRAALMAYADDIIATARSSAVHEDALGALLTARPSNRPLRARALRSHVLGLFLAGNETTAAALSWALVNGARSPAEWARVRAEPACAAPFVEETLRLDPAVWGIPRFARRGATLTVAETTAHVRRGEGATIYLRAMNRDPRVWPDPLRFDPARDRSPGTAQHRALLPFGLGPRGCIGQHLALAEMHAVLPVLARHGDVAVAEPIVEDPNFALRVRGGLRGSFSAPVAATRPSKPT